MTKPSSTGQKQPFKASKWFLYGGLGLLALVLVLTIGTVLSQPIERIISIVEQYYQRWFVQQDTTQAIVLLPLAFLGGVLASVSPCILAMLPVHLSYIGTLNIESRWSAFRKASLFVLGSVTVLSLFGLVSTFATAVMVDYRGYINCLVGLMMIIMGLGLIGAVNLPLPRMNLEIPVVGPYGVGLTFALVSSPCASPVLFSVLAAAAATGSQVLGIVTMISYALGYTLLIFLTSLFTGLMKQRNQLLKHSEAIIRFGCVALMMTGAYYLYAGTRWFLG
jgi:cytochrome c-type biogenesis protein